MRFLSFLTLLLCAGAGGARAEAPPHGPTAPSSSIPSHDFSRRAHAPETPQLAFHYGLIQPIFLRGFNAAVDLRMRRLVLSYSHGQGLDYSATPSLGLNDAEREAGLSLRSPWTTGGGIGLTLVDELYVMVDLKVHRYEASLAEDRVRYTTLSVGAELGYRLFLWKGLYLQSMLRYWPNVWTSLEGAARLGSLRHAPKNLGFFANVSLGWAFQL